jgi:hypothetical protein
MIIVSGLILLYHLAGALFHEIRAAGDGPVVLVCGIALLALFLWNDRP